jgi:FtsP/CotA-like multicopper oxidase with cupredoxin domain
MRDVVPSRIAVGCASLILTLALLVPDGTRAGSLVDPPMLASRTGTLDVVMVARPQLLPFTGQPAGYAYEVCLRPSDPAARRCPVPGTSVDLHKCPTANDPAASPYGGVRLQVTPGQTLRIRLVNCLPPAVDAKHADEDSLLKSNPTNLHTHGLIVEPHRADDARDPFGDYIFVLDLPDGSQPPTSMPMHGGSDHARNFDFRETVVDYAIPIDVSHPPGLFWFHPHVHGLSLNQVTGGLAGIITVGDVGAYVCDHGTTCAPGQLQPQVRHLLFKDTEITSDFRVRFQENPAMCATPDAAGNIGGCTGANTQAGTSTDADDGRWEFTVNGQTYPEIAIPQAGDIWRMANASASVTYNLGLFPPGSNAEPLVFQVLAIDGVSLVLPSGLSAAQANKLLGDKVTVVACPGAPQGALAPPASGGSAPPVCATSLRMMPSARVEIFIRGDSTQGQAVLRTIHRQTGPAGDDWPSIDLARLTFPAPPAVSMPTAERAPSPAYLSVAPMAAHAFAPGGVFAGPVKTRLAGTAAPVPVATLSTPAAGALGAARQARAKTLRPADQLDCTPLPPGQARQVLFGLPENKDHFGLGYRRVAANDTSPPPTADAVKIVEFDHAAPPTVCVQLGPRNEKVTETWMLVNLAGEDHNFHIHQTRFSVVASTGDGGTALPSTVNGNPVLLDNVPFPHATGDACDGTVGPWIAGTCKPTFVTVSIPFHEVGDFVYHCHILEHEDGGMMAKITVVPYRG